MTKRRNFDDGSSDISSTPSSMLEYTGEQCDQGMAGMKQCSSTTGRMSWQACGICVGEDKCMQDFGGETEV